MVLRAQRLLRCGRDPPSSAEKTRELEDRGGRRQALPPWAAHSRPPIRPSGWTRPRHPQTRGRGSEGRGCRLQGTPRPPGCVPASEPLHPENLPGPDQREGLCTACEGRPPPSGPTRRTWAHAACGPPRAGQRLTCPPGAERAVPVDGDVRTVHQQQALARQDAPQQVGDGGLVHFRLGRRGRDAPPAGGPGPAIAAPRSPRSPGPGRMLTRGCPQSPRGKAGPTRRLRGMENRVSGVKSPDTTDRRVSRRRCSGAFLSGRSNSTPAPCLAPPLLEGSGRGRARQPRPHLPRPRGLGSGPAAAPPHRGAKGRGQEGLWVQVAECQPRPLFPKTHLESPMETGRATGW